MVGARGFWLNGLDNSEGVVVNKDEAEDEENSRGGASGCGIWSRYLIVFFMIKTFFLIFSHRTRFFTLFNGNLIFPSLVVGVKPFFMALF